jgi:hypothetical protein
VPRLHARDDTERSEPVEVIGVDALDVDDLVASVARTVHLATSLHGVEHRSDPTVAGGVRERLEVPTLQLE